VSLNLETLETSFDLVPPYGDELMDMLRLAVAPAAPEQRILAVEFRSPDGRCGVKKFDSAEAAVWCLWTESVQTAHRADVFALPASLWACSRARLGRG